MLFSPAAASADAVLDWNAIAVSVTAGQNPFAQARFLAITQLAVFEAVNAITGEYEPYLGTIAAPAGASADAAAIAAAHRVLKNYFPANAATLDAARASSLAAIPDGAAKSRGIATGEAAAAAMIAPRQRRLGSAPPGSTCPGRPTGQMAADAQLYRWRWSVSALAQRDAVRHPQRGSVHARIPRRRSPAASTRRTTSR